MYIKNNLTEMIVDGGVVTAAAVAETGAQLPIQSAVAVS
jgi:hypothetical protein